MTLRKLDHPFERRMVGDLGTVDPAHVDIVCCGARVCRFNRHNDIVFAGLPQVHWWPENTRRMKRSSIRAALAGSGQLPGSESVEITFLLDDAPDARGSDQVIHIALRCTQCNGRVPVGDIRRLIPVFEAFADNDMRDVPLLPRQGFEAHNLQFLVLLVKRMVPTL